MPPPRQQINDQPIPPPLRSAWDLREWAAEQGLDPAHVGVDDDGYPYEDDEPAMGESYYQARQLRYGAPALEARYRDREDVIVGSDNYVHDVHDKRSGRLLSVAPDIWVAFGARPLTDLLAVQSYRIGLDGPAPSFVLEVLSKKTRKRDLGRKPEIYAHMGVAEYWILDPRGKDVPGHLEGYRLRESNYEPIAPSSEGTLHSAVLGLDIRAPAGELRFRDPATGEDLLGYQEMQDARDAIQAAHQATQTAYEEEQAMRKAAEAEVDRLRALLAHRDA